MISSYCNWGECASVELNRAGRVVVSSTVTGFEVSFTEGEFEAFVAGVKAGEFDLSRLRAARENPQVNAMPSPVGNDAQMITGEHPNPGQYQEETP